MDRILLRGRRTPKINQKSKSPPAGAEELGFGTSRADARQPFRPPSMRLGRGIRRARMSISLHSDLKSKSPPAGAEELGFGTSRADARQPFRPPSMRLGRGIRRARMSISLH